MIDIHKLNKIFVEIAKQEFDIDLNISNITSITNGFVKDSKVLLSFKESSYPVENISHFKLYIGNQSGT